MKKMNKFLALGLSVILAVSATACGSSGTETTTTTDAETDTTESAAETEAEETEDAETEEADTEEASDDTTSVYNEGETRTIKIGTWYDHYYDSTNEDIYDDPSVSDEELAQLHFDNVKRVEEKYNVKIEFVNLTWDGIQESINTSILSGKPDCDIYEVDLGFGIPAALNGYATNLEEVLPADADVLSDHMVFQPSDIGLDDGTYLFTTYSAETLLANTYMLAYNKQLLDDAGLEDPNALYERGEWTWDKWREYMIALTQDTNGDGVTDVYGYGSRFDFLINLMTMSNGTTIASSATENMSSPEVAECFEFIYNMYNVDHIANPWNVDDFDYNQNAYMDGTVAFWITAAWISNANADQDLGFDVVWCPFPVGPSGDQETNATKNVSSGNAWMIPEGVDDPELVYAVFEDWNNWYQGDTELRDGDLTWWEDCAITEENYAVMESVGEKGAFDIWNALGVDYQIPSLLDGTMTAAQFQETNKQLVQSALDALYQ